MLFRFCDGNECSKVQCNPKNKCPDPWDWDFVDDAAVISLSSGDSIRRRRVLHQAIMPVGLSGKVRDFVVDRHPEGGIVGCFTSHQKLMRQMQNRNQSVEWVLIFEDDARPFPNSVRQELVQELSRFCQSVDPKQPTIVQLGYTSPMIPFLVGSGKRASGFRSIYEAAITALTHSYLINRAAQDIVVGLDAVMHYDAAVMGKKMLGRSGVPDIKQYVLEPQMFFQCNCDTTVTANSILAQRVLGMNNVQKISGYCTVHPTETLLIMLSVFLTAICMVAVGMWLSGSRTSRSRTGGGIVLTSLGVLGIIFLGVVLISSVALMDSPT